MVNKLNNVIFILIDSVYSACLGNQKTEESSTPFLDKLSKESFCAKNIYSYAPYTDAATIGLYCGIPTLERFGYFLGINVASANHFQIFSENGYETYGLYYPYYLISPKTKKHIHHPIYTGGFKYGSVWGGKLEYYANIQKQRPLTTTEYSLIEKSLKLMFDCWIDFYQDVSQNSESALIVSKLTDSEDFCSGNEKIKKEYSDFTKDPQKYIDEVLRQGMSHPLAFINEFDFGKSKDFAFYKEIFSDNKKFFASVDRANAAKNLKNNHLLVNKALGSIGGLAGIGDRSKARYVENYGMLLAGNRMMKKRALNSSNWQEIASLNKQIDTLFGALENRDSSKPFYASLHVLEPHHNISYFSFDSFDKNLIKSELDYLAPLVKNCGKKFKGNLLYQLSLRYVDFCLSKMFDRLQKENLINNTTVVLVSDHGTSYSFDPVRTKVVNTFHKENYNIPCLIWKKDIAQAANIEAEGAFSSEDILPTVCKLEGIECPESCKGKVMYEEKGRDYIITEYMGPGVPDMISRDVWISIRSAKYVVAYKNNIQKPLDSDKPFAVYDLLQDPFELKNLAKEQSVLNDCEVMYLIEQLNARYKQIQKNTSDILSNMDDIVI